MISLSILDGLQEELMKSGVDVGEQPQTVPEVVPEAGGVEAPGGTEIPPAA